MDYYQDWNFPPFWCPQHPIFTHIGFPEQPNFTSLSCFSPPFECIKYQVIVDTDILEVWKHFFKNLILHCVTLKIYWHNYLFFYCKMLLRVHLISCWVVKLFLPKDFLKIWNRVLSEFEFCQNLNFWVWSHFDVIIWVFFSFVTIRVFDFHHNLSFWVSSQFVFWSFSTI